MSIVSSWSRCVRAVVLQAKTVCFVAVMGSKLHNRMPNVRLDGYPAVSVKYLVIRERMRFKEHLFHMKTKIKNAVCGLKQILWKDWRLGQRVICVSYKGLFVACVSYYVRAHGVICYASLKVRRTVSKEAMQLTLGLMIVVRGT